MRFGEILKELRCNNGYSMDALVELYNKTFDGKMNKSTLSRYENGLQEPMYTVVVNLSKLFDVTVDYLSGADTEEAHEFSNDNDLEERGYVVMFLENLKLLMAERGLNKNSLSLQSGIPYTTIDGFFKRSYENTKLSTLRQLATFFDVDLDFLVYGKEATCKHISPEENELISNFRKLNSSGKEKASDYVEDLTTIDKYTASAEIQSKLG